jgi:heavy metal sensor kinase
LHIVQTTLRYLIALLMSLVMIIVGLAWMGSGWLAREVLAPVETLSVTAARVSGTSLDTRVTLDAPYEEFQRLAHAFNAMLTRLQKVFEGQRRFVEDASHEIQTPLTVIKGNLEVALQRARTFEEYQEILLGSLGEVERLIALTRSLLTLARYAGDRPPVHLIPLALEPLLRDLVGEATVLADDRGVRLDLDVKPVPSVSGDAGQVKQVLINLLDNAFRHTPRGGTVTVRLESLRGQVTIAVEDTGAGIAPEHLPHLFERFYRADRARARNEGGTGLGLAIVKEIVEAYGGTVRVESEVGKGSIFIVTLPVVNETGSR